MKNKTVKLLAMVMVATSLLTGCGGTAKPSGTYGNGDVSFKFGKDTVIVTEGEYSSTVDYTIDSEGNIIIAPDTDELKATYDAENDVIKFYGQQYSK